MAQTQQTSRATKAAATVSRRTGAHKVRDTRSAADMERLWMKYKRTNRRKFRNALVEAYLPLVRSIARRIWVRLPDSVDLDDLVSAGTLGLIDAVQGFDLERGVCFKTYCVARVRGAILDDLRALDWAPRMVRSGTAKIEASTQTLGAKLGRAPGPEEIAEELGISVRRYETLLRGAPLSAGPLSLDRDPFPNEDGRPRSVLDAIEDRKAMGPAEVTEKREFKELVTGVLSDRERRILTMYYYHQLTMKEIGRHLELSESRVCQMHAHILKRLRMRLGTSPAFVAAAAAAE